MGDHADPTLERWRDHARDSASDDRETTVVATLPSPEDFADESPFTPELRARAARRAAITATKSSLTELARDGQGGAHLHLDTGPITAAVLDLLAKHYQELHTCVEMVLFDHHGAEHPDPNISELAIAYQRLTGWTPDTTPPQEQPCPND